MTSVPLASLIEDFSIYPRHAVDDANVASLVNALKSGQTLPPVVAERKSKRIVDGWHRARAYRRVLGPEASIDVELVDYESEEDLLLDSIHRNASHGRQFDAIDQVRAAHLCQERGISLQAIAAVLHVPVERVQKLTVRLAEAPKSGPGTIPGTAAVALKRPVTHLAGTKLTKEQVEAHGRAPGTSYLLIITQLEDAMLHDFLNRNDERLMGALRGLQETLDKFLKGKK